MKQWFSNHGIDLLKVVGDAILIVGNLAALYAMGGKIVLDAYDLAEK